MAKPVTATIFKFHTPIDMRDLDIEALHAATFSAALSFGTTVSVDGVLCDSALTLSGPTGDLLIGGTGLVYEEAALVGGTATVIAFDSAPGTGGVDWSIQLLPMDASALQAYLSSAAELTLLQELLSGPVVLIGSAGADRLLAGGADDILRGAGGRDSLSGGTGEDLLMGGLGADRLAGGADDDRLEGGRGTDQLRGDAGTDDLRGGAGIDRLEGGTGDDLLVGGTGADVFVLRNHHGNDTISDFRTGIDEVKILLRPGDPQNVELAFEYRDGACIVTFLDMTLTLENVAPGSLNFGEGGDFTLVGL